MMGRSFFTIVALIGFLSGVVIYLAIDFEWSLFLLLCIATLLLLALYRSKWGGDFSLLVALFLLFFCFGLVRSEFSIHNSQPDLIDYYNESNAEIQGIITEVDVRRDQAKYRLKVDYLSNKSFCRLVSGDILINTAKFPSYKYGDRLKLKGELRQPGEFNGFSYRDYLSRYGIYSVMYQPSIYLIDEHRGGFFRHWLNVSQNLFLKRINTLFPEPYASFEAGLLVGARKGIAPDLMEQFNTTGLTHIIAISGYNITLIIIFVMAALKGFPRKISFFIAIGSIVLFTFFVGASPAVVRASIMGVLGLIALQYGRQNNIHITLLFTACFMVLWNPKILWWDVGFQLSFMAVMGLIYVAPLLDPFTKYLPESLGIRESIQMTLAAQIMALPIIVFNFGRLSLIAPVANFLVAFALPLAMLFGFIALLLSFIVKGLALVFAYITSAFLAYIIQVIKWMAKVPYASIDWPHMNLWMLIGYYILLALFLWGWNKRQKTELKK